MYALREMEALQALVRVRTAQAGIALEAVFGSSAIENAEFGSGNRASGLWALGSGIWA